MKRRTIGLSLLMIGLVVGMLGIGSWAVFNDTETGGATLSAGTLDLAIGAGSDIPIDLDDLKPSVWQYAHVVLHNAGENPGVLDLHFADIVDSGGVLSGPEAAAEYAGAIDDISNWIDVDWCVDRDTDGDRACTGTGIGKLGDIESRVFDLEVTLQPGESVELWLSFHLETVAGNEYQGDVTNFNVEFTLHQENLGTLGLAAGTACVRLENKDAAYVPILGDELYGSVCYGVDGNGDLQVLVEAHGLTAGEWYQIGMTGPDACSATDDQLASGEQDWPDFDSHFWVGGAPSGTCTTAGFGFYNFDYVQANASGVISNSYVIANAGVPDPADSTDVIGSHPRLPSGVYTGVKFLIKDYTPNGPPAPPWPGTYTSVLMEMQTLDFNLP